MSIPTSIGQPELRELIADALQEALRDQAFTIRPDSIEIRSQKTVEDFVHLGTGKLQSRSAALALWPLPNSEQFQLVLFQAYRSPESPSWAYAQMSSQSLPRPFVKPFVGLVHSAPGVLCVGTLGTSAGMSRVRVTLADGLRHEDSFIGGASLILIPLRDARQTATPVRIQLFDTHGAEVVGETRKF